MKQKPDLDQETLNERRAFELHPRGAKLSVPINRLTDVRYCRQEISYL